MRFRAPPRVRGSKRARAATVARQRASAVASQKGVTTIPVRPGLPGWCFTLLPGDRADMASRQPFAVEAPSSPEPGSTLVVGQSHLGMAGVTAVDYLVRHLEATQIGHVAPETLPAIAPFEDGVPRHHSRLYALDGTGITVLVGELFIPVVAARSYTDALLEWADGTGIEEVAVLHGVPFPHGPEEHEVFHVATPSYRERRLPDDEFRPLRGGFLDGVVGELVTRSLDAAAPETGVFITPTHPPGPDVDAALRLLDALQTLYAFEVDETELRELGERMTRYYEQLAERMEAIAESGEALGSHDYPEDRMYM